MGSTSGQQTQVITPSGVTLNYQYDADGHVTQVSDSLGDTVTSQFDADGNLIQRSYSGPNSTQLLLKLSYDGDGNLTGISRYADLAGTQLVGTSSYSYNALGLATRITHKDGSGNVLTDFSYGYDAAGQLTQEVDNGSTIAYAYDANSQLIWAGTAGYSYDANGNPTNTGDSVGANNELLSDGTWNYSFDTNGNLIGKVGVSGGPDAGLTWTYSYDADNQLTGATETNGSQTLVQASYAYDVFGHRIQSPVVLNGGTATVTNYVYDGDQLWATLDGSGGMQTLYVSGDQPDQFFAQIDASAGVSGLLTDHLGSVRDVTNASGQVTDSLSYDAYGNITIESNPAQKQLIGFASYQRDAALGLDRAGGRWYNPKTGQWTTEDPLLLQPGPNPREYVNNGPTNATDPTGQELFALGDRAKDSILNTFPSDYKLRTIDLGPLKSSDGNRESRDHVYYFVASNEAYVQKESHRDLLQNRRRGELPYDLYTSLAYRGNDPLAQVKIKTERTEEAGDYKPLELRDFALSRLTAEQRAKVEAFNERYPFRGVDYKQSAFIERKPNLTWVDRVAMFSVNVPKGFGRAAMRTITDPKHVVEGVWHSVRHPLDSINDTVMGLLTDPEPGSRLGEQIFYYVLMHGASKGVRVVAPRVVARVRIFRGGSGKSPTATVEILEPGGGDIITDAEVEQMIRSVPVHEAPKLQGPMRRSAPITLGPNPEKPWVFQGQEYADLNQAIDAARKSLTPRARPITLTSAERAAINAVRGIADCEEASIRLQSALPEGKIMRFAQKCLHQVYTVAGKVFDTTARQYVGEGRPWTATTLEEAGLTQAVENGVFTVEQHIRFMSRVTPEDLTPADYFVPPR